MILENVVKYLAIFDNSVEQVGAELCQAQVKLEVVDEDVAEVGCRDCSWSKPHSVWVKVTTCPDGWVDGG